jgi:hypothetical protein
MWYHNAQGKEQGIAIRLTKHLAGTITKNHLFGRYIRITYKGSVKTGLQYSTKIFLVEVDKGAITEDYDVAPDSTKKHHKYRTKKIHRPEQVTVTA